MGDPMQITMDDFVQIDSLPYIDDTISSVKGMKDRVDALIAKEMRGLDSAKYEPKFPYPTEFSFAKDSCVATEYERVKAGKAMATMDTSRYQLEPPAANKKNDLNAWKNAASTAWTQLQHQSIRCRFLSCFFLCNSCDHKIVIFSLENLELALAHGQNAARSYNAQLEFTAQV